MAVIQRDNKAKKVTSSRRSAAPSPPKDVMSAKASPPLDKVKGKAKESAPLLASSTSTSIKPKPSGPTKAQPDPNAVTTTRLHVSGLNPEVSEADLRARFTSFGEVTAVDGWPAGKNALGDPINYAFLTLRTTNAKLSRCLSLLNNSAWKGSKLRIGEARPAFIHRQAKEAQERHASGWKAPAREEVEAKVRLEAGGAVLKLADVFGRQREGGVAAPAASRGVPSSSSRSSSSASGESEQHSSSSSDSDSDGDDDAMEQDQAQPAVGFSILGGLVLDDIEMDDEFEFGRVEGADDATAAGVLQGVSASSVWTTSTNDQPGDASIGSGKGPLPFLFPRFKGMDLARRAAGGGADDKAGPLRPVEDERNPAYRLLFRDLSEGITARSERVPPFCRTETLDEIEEGWKAKRRELTQDYKRRHREAVKKQRRRIVGSRATGGVVGSRGVT